MKEHIAFWRRVYDCVKGLNISYIISCMYSLEGGIGRDGIHNDQVSKLEEMEKLLKEKK